MSKVSKLFAAYQWHPHDGKSCAGCTMIRPRPKHSNDPICTKVEGPISYDGWCRFFYAAKKEKAANGGHLHPAHVARIEDGLAVASRRTDDNPSDGQKEEGNYAKGKFNWHGETISIENPKGSTRSGTDKDGKPWRSDVPEAYGYILKTKAVDGDHVDVYVGPDHHSKRVWVVDQVDHQTKAYDEPKALLSFASRQKALACYHKAFSDGKAEERVGSVTEMSIPEFKHWVHSPGSRKPLAKGYAAGGLVKTPTMMSPGQRRSMTWAPPIDLAGKYRGA